MPCSQDGFGFLRRSPRRSGWQNFRARRPRDRASSKNRNPAKRFTHCRRARSHRAGTTVTVATGLWLVDNETRKCRRLTEPWLQRPAHRLKSFVRVQFSSRTGSDVESGSDAQENILPASTWTFVVVRYRTAHPPKPGKARAAY